MESILNHGIIGEVYNIGSEEENEKSVIEVTKILIEEIHNTTDYNQFIEYVEDRPFNDQRYFINSNKLQKLGWKQMKKFSDEIGKLIN